MCLGNVFLRRCVGKCGGRLRCSSRRVALCCAQDLNPDRILQRIWENRLLPVPVTAVSLEQLVEVPKFMSQDRIQHRTLEQISDTPVPHVVEELVVVFTHFSKDGVSTAYFAEQIFQILRKFTSTRIIMFLPGQGAERHRVEQMYRKLPPSHFIEEIKEVPTFIRERDHQRSLNHAHRSRTHVHHVAGARPTHRSNRSILEPCWRVLSCDPFVLPQKRPRQLLLPTLRCTTSRHGTAALNRCASAHRWCTSNVL